MASPAPAETHDTAQTSEPTHPNADHPPGSEFIQQAPPEDNHRPAFVKHISTPAYSSPLRHHQRHPSTPHKVKESLNARSEYVTSQDDGTAEHRINQYLVKQEIGRGSFGAVHIAVDQFGQEYAVKEFSKSRLRKRAQSHVLRRPKGQHKRGEKGDFNSPLHRQADTMPNQGSALDLIKEEIAIMKKLNHPNLVKLIEVLDDPSQDSLYMVMEMCKKGVVMRIGLELGSHADPYPSEKCREWFRDLILGIEYLHTQGIVHRDIKPDNCLITEEDILKVVDFGVSEMFEKDSEMLTAKSAGSPAFMPPELCVAKHGDVSGRAADIWSMGVTLFCLKYGRIPFQKDQILEMYEAIKTDEPDISHESDADFRDLMSRLLEKDPKKRIKMDDLRSHPWVTCRGADPLLSKEENTAILVEPPTDAELEAAITGNMKNLMTVMKAVTKFKNLTAHQAPPVMKSILGELSDHGFTQPPNQISELQTARIGLADRSKSMNLDDRDATETALVVEGVHRELPIQSNWNGGPPPVPPRPRPQLDETEDSDQDDDIALGRLRDSIDGVVQPNGLPPFRSQDRYRTQDDIGRRGHAHDPLQDLLYLKIGPSTFAGHSTSEGGSTDFVDEDAWMVSESPGAADVDIYETAYRDEIERIMAQAAREDREPQVYLTRRVDEKLLQLSGLAGKLMAHGEEAKSQLMDYTDFTARKARVTEVSRALREAARAEYEKRRAERKLWIEQSKLDRAKHVLSRSATGYDDSGASTPRPTDYSRHWRDKAVDRGKDAKSSFKGFVDMVKTRRGRPD